MKRAIKIVIAAVTIMSMMFIYAGCGDTFNPSAYVRDSLDALKTGVVSDELVDLSYESRDELEDQIQENYDVLVDACFEGIEEKYITDEMKDHALAYGKSVFASLKYEVSDDYTETENGYDVPVTIYPITSFGPWQDYVSGEFTDDWMDKASSYTDEDTVMQDYYADYYKQLDEYFADESNITYGDPQDITLHLEMNDEGYYEIDEDDLDKMDNILLNIE